MCTPVIQYHCNDVIITSSPYLQEQQRQLATIHLRQQTELQQKHLLLLRQLQELQRQQSQQQALLMLQAMQQQAAAAVVAQQQVCVMNAHIFGDWLRVHSYLERCSIFRLCIM